MRIETILAERMYSSRNNLTASFVKHLKDNKIFNFYKDEGVQYIMFEGKEYQFATGEGEYAEVRQGVNNDGVGLIFFSTNKAITYKYEGSELETDKFHNKTNTSGVRLYTKKAKLKKSNVMRHDLKFDRNIFIKECKEYFNNSIKEMIEATS